MEKGRLIGQGRTADVYTWGSDRVVKLYQSWMPAEAIEREYAITRAACAAGIPVPAADELMQVDGRMGIVFEYVQGIPMLKVLESQPWKLIAMARLMADLHAGMHSHTIPAGLHTQRQQIEWGIDRGHDLSGQEKETILSLLKRLPEGDAICHGDFHPGNIMLTSRRPVIIDWMTGTRGYPLGDVARTSLLLTAGGLPPRISWQAGLLINVTRGILHAVYLRHYLRLRGASKGKIESWRLPILAARLAEVENYPAEKEIILKHIRALLEEM
jgi:uncharacterized protein (TIGR02172 family)